MAETDDRIDKRRVTMTSYAVTVDGAGEPVTLKYEAVDYVPPEILDAYVADASTRWQTVHVSAEPDAGPGGYDGETVVPEQLQNG